MNFFGKTFRTTLLFIVLLELFSLWGYLYPVFGQAAFIILILLFLIICLERLDWGVYIMLAELFIGSKGYLFYYDFNGTWISIRIAFWLVIMGVWLVKAVKFYLKKKGGVGERVANPPSPLPNRVEDRLCQGGISSSPPDKGGWGVKFFKSKLKYWFIALFAVISWGLLLGFIKGNSFNNIFDDFNAYLFFGLIFVFYDTITDWDKVKNVMQVFTASLVAMSLKTIGLLYFFSHSYFGLTALYKWIRTSGVGEITNMGGNYYRIFFQSHIFVIIGFILFLIFLLFSEDKFQIKEFLKNIIPKITDQNQRNKIQFLASIILLITTILISLSRSFWIGLIGGLIILLAFYLTENSDSSAVKTPQPLPNQVEDKLLSGGLIGFSYKKFIKNFIIIFIAAVYLFFIYWTKYYLGLVIAIIIIFYLLVKILKLPKKRFYNFTTLVIIFFLLGLGLINNVVKFPWPQSDVDIDLAELMGERAMTISGEAAVGSRWNLLKPLTNEIFQFPAILIGSGFGATVTYKSSDPRILEKNPTGEYTTYAFEWGYLDIWLKLGIIGLAIYLVLLWKVFLLGWGQLAENDWKIDNDKSKLVLGLLLGLIIVIVIHSFTPYLNHPLGIGYLLLCVVVFEVLSKRLKAEDYNN